MEEDKLSAKSIIKEFITVDHPAHFKKSLYEWFTNYIPSDYYTGLSRRQRCKMLSHYEILQELLDNIVNYREEKGLNP